MGALLSPTTDAAAINALVNDPSVRPSCGLPELGDLDFSDLIARSENLFLIGKHGGFMLLWSAPGVREVHVFLLPTGRGTWGFASQRVVVEAAAERGITLLWARINPDMPHLEAFARRGGMKPTGERIEALGTFYDIYAMEVPTCRQQ